LSLRSSGRGSTARRVAWTARSSSQWRYTRGQPSTTDGRGGIGRRTNSVQKNSLRKIRPIFTNNSINGCRIFPCAQNHSKLLFDLFFNHLGGIIFYIFFIVALVLHTSTPQAHREPLFMNGSTHPHHILVLVSVRSPYFCSPKCLHFFSPEFFVFLIYTHLFVISVV